jgi:hypothetical protein
MAAASYSVAFERLTQDEEEKRDEYIREKI